MKISNPCLFNALQADFKDVRDVVELSRVRIHSLLARMFMDSFGISEERCFSSFHEIIDNAERRLVESSLTRGMGTPKILHRIWLTNTASPYEPPPEYVEGIITNLKLAYQGNWQHYLWVQDVNLFPNTKERLQQTECPLQIRSIYDGSLTSDCFPEIEKFVADRKYAFASDILRMKILYEFGGIYADLGIQFRCPIDEFLELYEYAFIVWENLFFQNSLMMMPSKTLLGAVYLTMVQNLAAVPKYLTEPTSAVSEGWLLSGPMLTNLMFMFLPKNTNICPLAPNKELISWSSQKSWYSDIGDGEGKFGNAYAPTARPTLLSP